MLDPFNRSISYLRISVTDLCNLRCRYCMPEAGVCKREHSEIMSFEEIIEVTAAAARLGIDKVRITGGEPLVRRDLQELCRGIKAIPEIKELALTTNGLLLEGMAFDLKAAGVDRVNISIDSLNPEKYAYMTRGGDLGRVLRGIEAAKAAGLAPIKLNTVLIGGFNDDEIPALVELTRENEIEMRFIELMPIGESLPFWEKSFVPNRAVLEAVPELVAEELGGKSVAKIYRLPGARGTVGIINPVSNHFCKSCNRLRLTADGMLKPCLHSNVEIPVRGMSAEELEEAIKSAIGRKPENRGAELSGRNPSVAGRRMNQIGG